MVMKKIKPKFGKVTAPNVNGQAAAANNVDDDSFAETEIARPEMEAPGTETKTTEEPKAKKNSAAKSNPNDASAKKVDDAVSARAVKEPNPFLQTKEVFAKARLTKIGYRMRSDYVEVLDIIKKIKKGGYTLEAVLDDALTFYFENSEDGKEAIKKAEIFYS